MSTPHPGEAPTLPRSFLYVPAVRADLFDKALAGPADAIVLDLEDAVPVADKETARDHLRAWLRAQQAAGAGRPGTQRWVRVNAESLEADLDAVVGPALDGVFVAKCDVRVLTALGSLLDSLEPARGLPRGTVGVIGLVESAAGLLELASITATPRLRTLGLGEADLFADLRLTRSERSTAAVDAIRLHVVTHCAAAGLQAPVAPTSTAFRDLEAFTESSHHLLDLGFRSRTAIHPGQVPVINAVFSPTDEAVAAAEDVMARFEAAAGGVTTDAAGRLIDAAVIREARETLGRRVRTP